MIAQPDDSLYPFQDPVLLLDPAIPATAYTPLDLSDSNIALNGKDLSDPVVCQHYIDDVLSQQSAMVAYGGYLEKRNLYSGSPAFKVPGQPDRNIHLGLDLWTKAGTSVIVPLDGVVHSYANNVTKGDYGPTIILTHEVAGKKLYTLFGHLSLESLIDVHPGRFFKKGEVLGAIGAPEVNGNYASHLHFQLLLDLGTYSGDYPGVCNITELEYFKKNCPDPGILARVNR